MTGEAQAPDLSPSQPTHPTATRQRSFEIQNGASSSAEDGPRKRIRTTGNSSRGVANLTPEQLAKKRANDREAQRAIRERTKNQIESLERRIQELTSQQPYQELQHVLRQKEQVEAENAEIKKRLEQIIGLVQPLLQQNELPAYTPPQHPPIPNRPSPGSNFSASTPSSTTSPGTQWQSPVPRMGAIDTQYPNMPPSFQQLVKQRYETPHSIDIGPERLGLDFLLDGSQHVTKTNGSNTQETSYLPRLPDRNRVSSSTQYPLPNPPSQPPFYSIPVLNGSSTCPLDTILLEFLNERRSLLTNSTSPAQHLAPTYPSVASLLNPALAPTSHPVSKLLTDIIATFPDLSTLPEKVAILYIMFIYMCWSICPSSENYFRLPSWIRPCVSQVTTPHPAWVDYIPWPEMRDKIVRDYNPRDYLFDNFFVPFTTTVSVGWGYEDVDCLIRSGEGEGEVVINPVFERHVRRLENWSLGPAFERAFPGLDGTYRVVGEKAGRGRG